jgi:enoyl-CoA hydratase
MPGGPHIEVLEEGPVGLLLIDNPPRHLLTRSMIADLASAVPRIEADDRLRAVVVTGAGEADFCGGLDFDEWAALTPKRAQEEIVRGQDAFWALEHLTKPAIAAVSGPCVGAGLEFALACDVRIASETAVFSFPEISVAWMPAHGGTARLARAVGQAKALELLMTGASLKAVHALRLGLVNHVAPAGEGLEEAKRMARSLAERSRPAIRAIKRTLTEGGEKPYRNRFLLEAQHAVQVLHSKEYREAMDRIRSKRT